MSVVKFKKDVTQAEYDALEPKDASTLYFIVDTKTICLGEEIYGSHIEISDVDGNIIELTEDGLFAGLNVALDIGPENTDEEVPSAAATYEALVSVAPLWVGEPLPEGFFDGQIVDMPTLKNALSELSPVTGVKGAEEADFRTGEVELSPANLGAETASNKTVSLSAESTDVQYPTAKAVYDAVESLSEAKVDKSGTDRLMTAEEGTKLSGIATGAQVNPAIASQAEATTGTDNAKMLTPYAIKSAIDTKVAKNGTDRLMTAAEGTKLSGIATGAQVNPAIASQAEATAGTDNAKMLTPYAIKSAIDAKVAKNGTDRLMTAAEGTKLSGIATGAQVNPTIATEAEAKTGTDNAKMMTPLVSKKAVDAAIAIKADKNNTLQSSLYASNASTVGNPAVSLTYENIFANPPLLDMGALHYMYVQFLSGSAVAESKGPITDSSSVSFNVLTMTSMPNRAVQLAVESFAGSHAGEIYVRIRHIDNTDYSVWQEWKKVVFAQKSARIAFPVATGFVLKQNSYVSKDALSVVTIVATVGKSSGTIASGDLLGKLADGYLPFENTYVPGSMFADVNNPTPSNSCVVVLKTNGEIYCYGSGYANVSFNMSYALG